MGTFFYSGFPDTSATLTVTIFVLILISSACILIVIALGLNFKSKVWTKYNNYKEKRKSSRLGSMSKPDKEVEEIQIYLEKVENVDQSSVK